MGNIKSKSSRRKQKHEKLDENDVRYFDKVHKRNRVVQGKSKSNCFGGISNKKKNRNSSALQLSPQSKPQHHQQQSSSSKSVRNRTALLERAEDPLLSITVTNATNNNPHVGPLTQKTSLNVPKVCQKPSPNKSPTRKSRKSKTESTHNNHSLPLIPHHPTDSTNHNTSLKIKKSISPSSGLNLSPNERLNLASKKILKNRKNKNEHKNDNRLYSSIDRSPFDRYSDDEDDNKITSSASNSNDETSKKSFDDMLSSGMIWADMSRGGKISCIAMTPPQRIIPENNNSSGRTPLLLAIGSDDGFVAVVEVLDDGLFSDNLSNSSRSSHGSKQTQNKSVAGIRKFGPIREMPREGKIRCLDFSPDGKYLAIGGDDCTASIIDVGRDAVRNLEGHDADTLFQNAVNTLPSLKIIYELEREDRVYSTRFSPCGTMIAIAGFDGLVAIGTIIIDDLGMDVVLTNEIPRLGLILDVDWTSDGSLLAIGGSDKRAAIINVHDNRMDFIGNDGNTSDDDGSSNASKSIASNIGPWEVAGEIQRSTSVQCVKWNPDGSYLAIGGHDGVVAIIDIHSRSILKEIQRPNIKPDQSSQIYDICWSPDGKFLAIASHKTCAIVEMKTFMIVHDIQRAGHVNCVDWSYQLPNNAAVGGRYLAVGSDDQSIVLIKTGADDDEVSQCSSGARTSDQDDCSSLSSTLSWHLEEGSFKDIDEEIGALEKQFNPKDDKISIKCVTFSSGSNTAAGQAELMAVAASDGRVTVSDTSNWSLIKEFQFPKAINDLKFSFGGSNLALGGESSSYYVISVGTWEIIQESQLSASVLCLDFSMNNEILSLGLSDGILAFVNPSYDGRWEVAGEMDESNSSVLAVTWSSCGKHLAVGRSDSAVTIHDSQSIFDNFFIPKVELNRKTGSPVHSLAFGVEGNYLAVGGGDWNITIYSCKGSWPACRQLNTAGWIMSLKWSPDHRFLAVGGNDTTLGAVVYDTISWKGVDELQGIGAGEEINSLDWSADGKFLVVAGGEGICRVVDMTTCQLIHWLNVDRCEQNEKYLSKDKQCTDKLSKYFDNEGKSNDPKTDPAYSSKMINTNENSAFQQFLRMRKRISLYYRYQDHPKVLDFFMTCLQMLNEHVEWFEKIEDITRKTLMNKDDGELLISLLQILDQASTLIENILQKESDVSEWWQNSDKFNLTSRQTRRVTAWNEYCQRLSVDPPIIDIELLSLS